MRRILTVVAAGIVLAGSLGAQARELAPPLRPYVTVNEPVVALTNARVVDGTGAPVKDGQTIVIRGEKIAAVGPAGAVQVPAGARSIDLQGKTVIPGIIGLHDHMYYSGMRFMGSSYPRLYISAGVTTIRTTGSVDAYQELNLKRLSDSLRIVAPTIVVTGPYLQGAGSGFVTMPALSGPESARRMVRYWAQEGVTWFKAYTQVSRAELGAAIDEAHKHGVKVTAHLCSVGFREAVALGIDALEHGMLTNTEWYTGKKVDQCPQTSTGDMYGALDVNSAEVQRTIQEMVKKNVALTSTLDVFELSSPSRVPFDQRVLDAVYPDLAKQVAAYWVGTIAAGMHADLVVIAGDPVRTPGDIRNVETVFRRGLGYDAVKLKDSIKGMVGIR